MNRLVDPDFSFFFRNLAGVSRHRTSLYDRGMTWRSELSRRNSSKKLTSQIRESSNCTFRPHLTRKGRSISSSFRTRLNSDLRSRENSKIISEFLRKERNNDEMNFSYRPDLSLTQKFNFSRYVTRKIVITH
jgi:hypothetical protein